MGAINLAEARALIASKGQGIYDMPAEQYHADPCPTPSLSASGMKLILDDCPARFWHGNRRLNPAATDTRTKALDIGTAAHAWLLSQDTFEASISVKPSKEDYPSAIDGVDALRSHCQDIGIKPGRTIAEMCRQIREADPSAELWPDIIEEWSRLSDGKTVISQSEFGSIKAMRDAAMSSDMVRMALSAGKPEQSLFWKDEETGVWLRCRPDFLPTVPRFVPDFKTARSAHPNDFRRSTKEFGYHIQAAHYLDGIEQVTGTKPDAFFFIVQEKTAPYLVSLCTLDEEAMLWGARLARRAIRIFAHCLDTGRWPGYDGGVSTIGLPGWAVAEYNAMDALGHFNTINDQKELTNVDA